MQENTNTKSNAMIYKILIQHVIAKTNQPVNYNLMELQCGGTICPIIHAHLNYVMEPMCRWSLFYMAINPEINVRLRYQNV